MTAHYEKYEERGTRSVYIVDGARTPFIKAGGKPNPLSAVELAVAAAAPLLERQTFKPEDIGEVIAGCVAPSADEANIGRIIALRLGCGNFVEGWTVQRNCASGLQALDSAATDIMLGRHDLVLAGGTESLSRTPLLYPEDFVAWLADFRKTSSIKDKFSLLLKLKPQFFVPVVSLLKGLADPVVNLSMGQTAENLTYEFGITREQMDAFSVQSHQLAAKALESGYFVDEMVPLYDWQGNVIVSDNGIRNDSTIEKLATLKAAFDKPFGNITAGNSSQVSDGAAFLILASQKAVEEYQLPVLGRIIDTAWAALDPTVMGLGPVYAIQKLLSRQHLSIADIDYWEINEAFSAQVLACLKAMRDEDFCETQLGVPALGILPIERLNVDGGAVAIGHPVGASGARLVLHLLHVLKRHHAKRGIASLCIGGGQGGAMLIESIGDER